MNEPVSLTEAEFRTEIERLELMGRNWIARHGKAKSNRKLFKQFLGEARRNDPRLREAVITMVARQGIEDAAREGIITCFPDGTFKLGPNEMVKMPNGKLVLSPRR